jgi:hypothetical protein
VGLLLCLSTTVFNALSSLSTVGGLSTRFCGATKCWYQ